MARMDIPQQDAMKEEVVTVANALVVPPPLDAPNAPQQRSGVFDANGDFVQASHLCRPHGYFNDVPDLPDPGDIEELPGTWMFGGVLFGHFGHFLMDSMARAWAYGDLKGKIDGIVFTPKTNGGNPENMFKVQTPLLRALGLDADIRMLRAPTRIETLHVPWQGLGIGSGWELGTPAFRRYMRDNAGGAIAPKGPERVYLSRSALPKARASFLAEDILEAHLADAGYEIVHPQQLSKEDQIALYRAAKWIISPDGSPLHLLAYVGNADQHVAVIARRNRDTNTIFGPQIEAFTGASAITINCLLHDWLPEDHNRPGRLSWGEFDMPGIYDGLMAGGFLPEGTPRWEAVPEETLRAELDRITQAEGKSFRRWEGDAG